jgi:L-alanine-DL-glutamate epimerase-like enolase superfamily enzyme
MLGVPTAGLSEREARETLVERFYCDFAANQLGDVIDPRNNRIAVPQGPGLDVDPDPRLIEKLRK